MEDLAGQLIRARNEGGAYPVARRAVIRLGGADAFRYLNGQVTRDLGRLGNNESLPACILTPKGKLCATMLVSRDGSDLLVEVDPALLDEVTARLERYIVADDVTFTLEPPEERIHLFGDIAEQAPWSALPGIRVRRLGVPGKDLRMGEEVALPPLLDPRVVETLRIERMIPAARAELKGEILPPEAGLDLTHIDYDRGCYPGQEVISRLKSIGRVNRLLHLLTVPTGCEVTTSNSLVNDAGERQGEITSASTQWDTGAVIALGYLPRGVREPVFAEDPLTGSRSPLSITPITGP
jgi:folate-binding protein YgfZ